MQRFERSSVKPPAFLRGDEVAEARREIREFLLLEPNQRSQTAAPVSSVSLDNDNVLQALSTLFHGKCAFCERFYPNVQHYRFRPVADALPTKRSKNHHLYYSWLSLAWENIYPICFECIPHRPDFFPVDGPRLAIPTRQKLDSYVTSHRGSWGGYPLKEVNLLLDPCIDDSFHIHMHVSSDGSLWPLSFRGEATIEFFHLDRPELAVKRTERLEEYLALLLSKGFKELCEGGDGLIEVLNFSRLEFGGLWYLQCRQIAQALTSKSYLMHVDALSPTRIVETLAKISRTPNFELALEKLRGKTVRTDFGLKLLLSTHRVKVAASRRKKGTPPLEYSPLYALAFENFKSIEDLKLEMSQPMQSSPNQTPSLLILGENAAGKSSVLEGIALALTDEVVWRGLDINERTLSLDTSLLGAKLGANRKVRSGNTTVTLSFQKSESRVLKITGNSLRVSGLPDTPPVFAYGAFRQYQDVNAPNAAPAGSVVNLFHSHRFLLNPEAWLLSLEKNTFDEVIRVLRIIFSVDSNFAFMLRDKKQMRCLLVTTTKGKRTAGKTPLKLASSGYRSLLAMVCDILRGLMDPDISPHFQSFPTAQAVVLIDEVEAHLHPRWKIRVMSALREALPKVTFIATSHDPLCLRGMHHGEVVVMRRRVDVKGDLSVKVDCMSDLPDVGQLTIEQLLTSDFFNLMSTDQPDIEFQLAHIADLLTKKSKHEQLNPDEDAAVNAFEGDIRNVMPIGGTEAQRLVQEAVAEFLKKRFITPAKDIKAMRKKYRDEVIGILERF